MERSILTSDTTQVFSKTGEQELVHRAQGWRQAFVSKEMKSTWDYISTLKDSYGALAGLPGPRPDRAVPSHDFEDRKSVV